MGRAWEWQLWFDRAGGACQGPGKLSIFLVGKLKSDFWQKFMAEEGETEVIKRSWRGDSRGRWFEGWRSICWSEALTSLMLEVFKFWAWLKSLACWCEFGGWPCFLGCPERKMTKEPNICFSVSQHLRKGAVTGCSGSGRALPNEKLTWPVVLVLFLIPVNISCHCRISRSTWWPGHANTHCFPPRFPPGLCGSCSVQDSLLPTDHIFERGCLLSVMWPLKPD